MFHLAFGFLATKAWPTRLKSEEPVVRFLPIPLVLPNGLFCCGGLMTWNKPSDKLPAWQESQVAMRQHAGRQESDTCQGQQVINTHGHYLTQRLQRTSLHMKTSTPQGPSSSPLHLRAAATTCVERQLPFLHGSDWGLPDQSQSNIIAMLATD